MSGLGSPDPRGADDVGPRQRWADAVEWTVDSGATLWSAFKRFVRAQMRSGKKLALWIIFAFVVATFVVAWITVGTDTEPTGCEGLQAITEPDCS